MTEFEHEDGEFEYVACSTPDVCQPHDGVCLACGYDITDDPGKEHPPTLFDDSEPEAVDSDGNIGN